MLSKTSKLGCLSWSLQAFETCPGAKNKGGTVVPACQGCYARGGNYRFENVRKLRHSNRVEWERPNWVERMVESLTKAKAQYFRWFDSGDIYHPELARKIKQVIEQTPETKHWLPTRSYKVERIRRVLEEIRLLPNVMVRYSSDSIQGEFEKHHGSTIVAKPDSKIGYECIAYKQGGQCLDCRACWSKDVPLVSYVAHGRTMIKLVKENTK